ncbi:MAG: glycosyltransferase WbuB [Gemmatimonadetes bacterium]|nr:glycosyltransferase WbuB [Gemmatimonadota bacterium]
MRLLVVSQYFWPEDFRVNELVAELSARGHQITVLTGKPNYPTGRIFEEFVAAPQRFASYAGARIVRVPMLARGNGKLRLLLNYLTFAVSATAIGAVRFGGGSFDAIFVFEPSPVTVGIPAIALRALHGWPIAFWVLDQWPESLAAVGVVRSKWLLNIVGSFVRFIYTRCDLILSPSKRLVPRIAEYCLAGQRIEYFPNWAETGYASAPLGDAPEVLARPESFNVMFAGNIGEAQDFPTILDAAVRLRKHAHIRWLVVGDGRMAGWVRTEIKRRGLEDSVVMLGRFPADRIPSFFRHADALLVSLKPNLVFSMMSPGKIQSYLAFGRPVLAMLDGEGAAIIHEAQAGLVGAAGDAKQLAENVLSLAALSAEQRAAMGRNGAAYAQREFARNRLVDRLETWLCDIVSPRHANREP